MFNDEIDEHYVLVSNADFIPPITYVKNDPKSSVVVTEATNITSEDKKDRTTTVTVTAEDGSTTKNYTFEFHLMDGLGTLDSLSVSEGELIPDFNPEILNYTVEGITQTTCPMPAPSFTYKASSPFASVTISNATNICRKLFNKTSITVTPDDGSIANKKVYTIDWLLTGINETYSTDFIIYPNPAQDILNIEHKSPMVEVTILDILGKKICNYEMNSAANGMIQLKELKKGMYFIQMKDGSGKVYTRKVVKD